MPDFNHFSTKADYEQLVASDELFSNLYFVRDMSYREDSFPCLKGILSIPDLGVANKKGHFGEPKYWVFPEEPKLRFLKPKVFEGQRYYDFSDSSFKVRIQFTPNGVFWKKTIVKGIVDAGSSPNAATLRLYREISKGFERIYTKVKSPIYCAYAGPNALALQKEGYRLCLVPHYEPEHDFNLPNESAPSGPVNPKGRRRSLAETWKHLEANGQRMPRDGKGKPLVPPQMPNHDDDELGFSFFRNSVEEADYGDCTLPRTFFGRSGLTEVSFRNTDLSESRMCWNDFTGCDFSKADLSGCDMRASQFKACKFDGAKLKGADLRRSSFEGSSFKGTDLKGAVMDNDSAADWGADRHLSKAQVAAVVWHDEPGEQPPGG
jgi:BTB/POZ domain-containing protein KCTD9